MTWYYAEGNQQAGPIEDEEFAALVRQGRITPNTLVWRDGMADWRPFGEVRRVPTAPDGVAGTAEPVAGGVAVCAECGGTFPIEDMVRYRDLAVCARCKAVFFQRVQEGAALPGAMRYGGFWIRFAAKFIDGVILGIVNMVVTIAVMVAFFPALESDEPSMAAVLLLQLTLWGLQMGIQVAYITFFLGRFAATPGKMILRLHVVRPDGARITYMRAFARCWAEMLSGLILLIGYIIAAFDDEKRTLHDRICDTRVVVS